jgi:TRAP-type transport system periplasmic protein
MKRFPGSSLVLTLMTVLVVTLGARLAAAPVLIAIASSAPANSLWDKVLQEMGQDWQTASAGNVRLRVMRAQGDESTIIRKMQISNQLQAATLTGIGLSEIDPAFNVFGIPLFYDSYDEFFAVQDALTPILKARLDAKGLVLVHWGHAGWVQVFSKKPAQTIGELKAMKLFTSAATGDDAMVQWYKNNGFRPVPLAATDMAASLQQGMIEVVPAPPLVAFALMWYTSTPYMLDLGLAPLTGATVVTKKAWNNVPEADRPKLLDAALKAQKRLRTEVPGQDAGAVTEMTKKGLKVIKADVSSPKSEWRVEAEKFASSMRGGIVPADLFDAAIKERENYRKQHPPKGGR